MVDTAEEARAAAWRVQQRRRAESDLARQRALRGDPEARRLLGERWAPLINRDGSIEIR